MIQSPLIEKSNGARYLPGEISSAVPNDGAIPGCVMFPSKRTLTPLIGLPSLPEILKVIVAGPARGG
jgi:hypothetical protein